MLLKDEEELKLSAQQASLLKQELAGAQSHGEARGKQAQQEQMQLQRLEQRFASLQGQADEQTSQTRYADVIGTMTDVIDLAHGTMFT